MFSELYVQQGKEKHVWFVSFTLPQVKLWFYLSHLVRDFPCRTFQGKCCVVNIKIKGDIIVYYWLSLQMSIWLRCFFNKNKWWPCSTWYQVTERFSTLDAICRGQHWCLLKTKYDEENSMLNYSMKGMLFY